jgi:hypothetical protein
MKCTFIEEPIVPLPTTVTPSVQEILEKKMDDMKLAFEKEQQEMKAQIAMLLDKHAGTTNNNNTTNTNNIKTQNINIIIKAFGNENTDYIDDKAILSCISKAYKSIPSLLEEINFDPKWGATPPYDPSIGCDLERGS